MPITNEGFFHWIFTLLTGALIAIIAFIGKHFYNQDTILHEKVSVMIDKIAKGEASTAIIHASHNVALEILKAEARHTRELLLDMKLQLNNVIDEIKRNNRSSDKK